MAEMTAVQARISRSPATDPGVPIFIGQGDQDPQMPPQVSAQVDARYCRLGGFGPAGSVGDLLGYVKVSISDQRLGPQLDALKGTGCQRAWSDTASGSLTELPERPSTSRLTTTWNSLPGRAQKDPVPARPRPTR